MRAEYTNKERILTNIYIPSFAQKKNDTPSNGALDRTRGTPESSPRRESQIEETAQESWGDMSAGAHACMYVCICVCMYLNGCLNWRFRLILWDLYLFFGGVESAWVFVHGNSSDLEDSFRTLCVRSMCFLVWLFVSVLVFVKEEIFISEWISYIHTYIYIHTYVNAHIDTCIESSLISCFVVEWLCMFRGT